MIRTTVTTVAVITLNWVVIGMELEHCRLWECDHVGVLGSWPPHFLALWGSKCAWTPHFLVPCCYTWPVIHSISGWTLHAYWFQCGVYKAVWLYINCIEMFGSGWAGSVQTPWRVHEREGKKGGLKKGERWPGPPKIYDRSPPLVLSLLCEVDIIIYY